MNSCSGRGGRGFRAQMRLVRRTDSKRLAMDNSSQKELGIWYKYELFCLFRGLFEGH